METSRNRAKDIIKSVSKLIIEFEEAKISPNVVFLTAKDFDLIKESFPYLVQGNALVYNNRKLQVIFTAQLKTVGVAMSLHTDFVEEFSAVT